MRHRTMRSVPGIGRNRMQVSLIYVDCRPTWRVARERLAQAIESASIGAVTLVLRLVITHQEAMACGLCGSPTLLIDGSDPFAGPDVYAGIYCRSFLTEAGPDVAPSVTQLVAALRRARDDVLARQCVDDAPCVPTSEVARAAVHAVRDSGLRGPITRPAVVGAQPTSRNQAREHTPRVCPNPSGWIGWRDAG